MSRIVLAASEQRQFPAGNGHPKGTAPRIMNFAEWARHILEGFHQEVLRHSDGRLADLYAELGG
jgi:hypothetical protein